MEGGGGACTEGDTGAGDDEDLEGGVGSGEAVDDGDIGFGEGIAGLLLEGRGAQEEEEGEQGGLACPAGGGVCGVCFSHGSFP